MGDVMQCVCGRVWQIRTKQAEWNRRGTIKCRCFAFLLQDDDGSRDALLVRPRERFTLPRQLLGHSALYLLRLGTFFGISVFRWIRPGLIPVLIAPNKAIHVRHERRIIPLPDPGTSTRRTG